MRKLLLLVSLLILLTGCSYKVVKVEDKDKDLGSDREITQEEITKFVPVNYELVSDEFTGKVLINKYNLGESFIYILPLKSEIEDSKVIMLGYNRDEDKYNKLGEYNHKTSGEYSDIYGYINEYDVNNDGYKELFVLFRNYYATEANADLVVFDISDKVFKPLLESEGFFGKDYYEYDEDSNEIMIARYLWKEGETHFQCHNFLITKYDFVNGEFNVVDRKETHYQYDMDGYQANNITCLPLENIYRMLTIEGIRR